MYIYVYIYVYICIYICIYTYIYVYILYILLNKTSDVILGSAIEFGLLFCIKFEVVSVL